MQLKKNIFFVKLFSFVINALHLLVTIFIPQNKKPTKIIVVLSLHKLGDTVFSIPSIKLLNRMYNTKNVKVVCYDNSKAIYRKELDNELITFRFKDFFLGGRIASIGSLKKVFNKKPELIYDLTGNIKTVSLLLFNKNSKTIGFNDSYHQSLYDEFRLRNNKVHLVRALTEIVEPNLSDDNFFSIVEYDFKKTNKDTILIQPYAGWKAKEWGFEKFVQLAKKIQNNFDKNVKFIFQEESTSLVQKNLLFEKELHFIETKSIDELITEISDCYFLIGNDSGPVYIASMLGKATFSVYGPTNPEFSVPFGDHHGFIKKNIHCSPKTGQQYCFTNAGRKGCKSFECMNQLSVEEVYTAIKNHLALLTKKNKSDH